MAMTTVHLFFTASASALAAIFLASSKPTVVLVTTWACADEAPTATRADTIRDRMRCFMEGMLTRVKLRNCFRSRQLRRKKKAGKGVSFSGASQFLANV